MKGGLGMRYTINKNTYVIKTEDKNTTKIIEMGKTLNKKENPATIISDSCSYYRYSLNYRVEESKKVFKSNYKNPIIIDNDNKIIFFPIKSITSKENTWISYNNLVTFLRKKHNTVLVFFDGSTIIVPVNYSIISSQVSKCFILDKMLEKLTKKVQK